MKNKLLFLDACSTVILTIMDKYKKNNFILFLLLLMSTGIYAQQMTTVTDNMQWVNNGSIQQNGNSFQMVSPNLNECDFKYTITSTGCGFGVNTFTPSGGITLPANHNACSDTEVEYTITFSQPVTNLRIHVSDMDEVLVPGATTSEHFKFNAPLPISTSFPTLGGIYLQGGNVVTADNSTPVVNDDAQGWINFGGQSITSINFTYNKPTAGYIALIDAIEMSFAPNAQAAVDPVSHLGYTTMPSYYGPQQVARFCQGDIIVDGSATQNETDYNLTLAYIDLNTWNTSNIYSGWTSGQAPNNIDVLNNSVASGINLAPGAYMLTLATGPCWVAEHFLLLVEECCPETLSFEIDCENEVINLVGLPSSIVNVTTVWAYTDTAAGTPSVSIAGGGLIPSVSTAPHGSGGYTVNITYTLANGMECKFYKSILLTEEYCCEQLGPNLNATITSGIIGNTVEMTPYGNLSLPIVRCDGIRILMDFDCYDVEPSSVYVGLETFNPSLWAANPNGFVYSNANYTSGVHPFISTGNFVTFSSNEWYLLTICVGSDCEYLVFKTPECSIKSNDPRTKNIIDMSLAPNPGKYETTVNFSQKENGKLIVRSAEGREVYSQDVVDQGEVTLDISNYKSGIYFIEFFNEEKRFFKRLLKE